MNGLNAESRIEGLALCSRLIRTRKTAYPVAAVRSVHVTVGRRVGWPHLWLVSIPLAIAVLTGHLLIAAFCFGLLVYVCTRLQNYKVQIRGGHGTETIATFAAKRFDKPSVAAAHIRADAVARAVRRTVRLSRASAL